MEALYILDKGKVRRAESCEEYARFFAVHENKVIDRTKVDGVGDVSTVFLGLDHGSGCDDNPLAVLFETLVFGDASWEWADFMLRYRTMGDAKRGHWAIVQAMRDGKSPMEFDLYQSDF
jgi:hypothetical protein